MAGTLYIVATPIGNLSDTSQRVLETLRSVDLILAEDTRVAQKLLTHFDIKRVLESYHQHSSEDKKLKILNDLLNGKNIALVSDAGTPGISDPGNELIDFIFANSSLQESSIKIIPIPGPSALTAALSVCGFNISNFLFIGFWPKKKLKKTIDVLKNTAVPVVFYESPYRILKTLKAVSERLGSERRVFVGREITKLHETHYRGNISEVLFMLENEKNLKGELVVVIE